LPTAVQLSPWSVEREDSVLAARRNGDRTLVLCWPPFEDDKASYDVLRAYRGGTLVASTAGTSASIAGVSPGRRCYASPR